MLFDVDAAAAMGKIPRGGSLTRRELTAALSLVLVKPSRPSASGANQGAIDNRIEQAMDLVKSHLMNAVRSEMEELKEKIVKLEDTVSTLQYENDYLRSHASEGVLSQLQFAQQQLPQQQQQPQVQSQNPSNPQQPQKQ